MNYMKILKRKISPYTGRDLILGVFSSLDNLNEAKRRYVESCREYDEYSEQAYHVTNLDDDLEVIDIIPQNYQLVKRMKLYVLSECSEGFGQTVSNIINVYNSRESANKRFIESEESMLRYFDIEEVELDKLNFVQVSIWLRFRDSLVNLREEKINYYLGLGFDINERNENGETLLHNVVEEGVEVIKRTVALGIDLNATDNNGWTFLFYFRKYLEPNIENVGLYEWLIDKGAYSKPNVLENKWKNV